MPTRRAAPLIALALLAVATEARADTTTLSVEVLIREGDAALGQAVLNLFPPRTNRVGGVMAVGDVTDGTPFVYVDGAIIDGTGLTLDATNTAEAGGISDAGDYAWLPLNALAAVELQTGSGVILSLGTNGGLTGDIVDMFRASMLPGGAAYVYAEEAAATVIYVSPDASAGAWTPVVSTGDAFPDVCAATGTNAITLLNEDYDISDNGNRAILQARVTDCGADDLVAVGDATGGPFVWTAELVEGFTVAGMSTWQNFDAAAIDNSGNFLVSGDTNDAAAADELIAYNGSEVLIQNDVVDGVQLGSNVRWVGLDNQGRGAFTWTRGEGGGGEALFVACDATNIAVDAHLVISTGTMVDTDGDGAADATVSDFNFNNNDGPLFQLDDDFSVVLGVDLGTAADEAIIRIPFSCCVGDRTCGDTDGDNVCEDIDICLGDDATGDTDMDGVCDDIDACDGDDATGDTDMDGVCDDIDACTGDDATGDTDMDGVCDDIDACDGDDATGDTDMDGVCDDIDACTGDDATGDTDMDGICDDIDACNGDDATGDTDMDGVCDDIDACDGDDATGDTDGDLVCDDVDICDGDDATGDTDMDDVCDDIDACDGDDATGDTNSDGICDNVDDCDGDDATGDTDMDGVCDDTDPCPLDNPDDSDGDTVCDSNDECPDGDDLLDDDNNGVPDDCESGTTGTDSGSGTDTTPGTTGPGMTTMDTMTTMAPTASGGSADETGTGGTGGDDAGAGGDDSGCGCRSTAPTLPAGLWWLTALAFIRRRSN